MPLLRMAFLELNRLPKLKLGGAIVVLSGSSGGDERFQFRRPQLLSLCGKLGRSVLVLWSATAVCSTRKTKDRF